MKRWLRPGVEVALKHARDIVARIPGPARQPEYQELVARMMDLYKQITDKALENEKASR